MYCHESLMWTLCSAVQWRMHPDNGNISIIIPKIYQRYFDTSNADVKVKGK